MKIGGELASFFSYFLQAVKWTYLLI